MLSTLAPVTVSPERRRARAAERCRRQGTDVTQVRIAPENDALPLKVVGLRLAAAPLSLQRAPERLLGSRKSDKTTI
jgi:hypothetical protein